MSEEVLVVVFGNEDGNIVGCVGEYEFDNSDINNDNQNYVSEDNDE